MTHGIHYIWQYVIVFVMVYSEREGPNPQIFVKNAPPPRFEKGDAKGKIWGVMGEKGGQSLKIIVLCVVQYLRFLSVFLCIFARVSLTI